MHIIIVVIVGFAALAAFYFGAPLCNRSFRSSESLRWRPGISPR
jgi:hypothetical protein